jgi:hypothetical protein
MTMGVFEFECPDGHITNLLVSYSERPAEIACGTEGCGKPAKFIVSSPKTTFHANDRKAIKGQTINRGGIRT